METIKIEINEMQGLLAELDNFKSDSPIWFARGRTIISIQRKLKSIMKIYEAEKTLLIEKWCIPDAKDKTGYKTSTEYKPHPETGKPIPINKYEFNPDQKEEAQKAFDNLHKYHFIEDEKGQPILIDVEVHKVSSEIAQEMKKGSFSNLALTIEYLFPKEN